MDLLSTTKVAAAGIAGAGGSGGAVYGTYYLVTRETKKEAEDTPSKGDKELLKEWMTQNKCTIKTIVAETTGSPNNIENIEFSNSSEDKVPFKGLLEWLKTNGKTDLACDGNTEKKDLKVKITNKTNFQKQDS